VLVVVAALIGALVLAGPGIGDSAASAMRSTMCMFDGAACGGQADVAGGPANQDGEGGAPPGQADAEPQADEDGGGWLDRLGPVGDVLDQGGQLISGFGSQLWDEVKGLGETGAWIWRTITSEEQRRENGEVWDAIVDDPLGAAGSILSGIWEPIQDELDTGRPAAAAGRGAATVLSTIFGGKGLTKLRRLRPDLDDVAVRPRPDADADDLARRPRVDCLANSFLAATLVLLGDGSRVPIAEVDVGTQVLAADPETGQVQPRAVTDVIVGGGVKSLVDVTVGGQVLTATDRHPFYLPAEGRWADAANLEVGDQLLTAGGLHAPVEAVAERRAQAAVHNLTVAGLHTYFVAAGPQAVLVHNAAEPCRPPTDPAARQQAYDDLARDPDTGRSRPEEADVAMDLWDRGEWGAPRRPGRPGDPAGADFIDDSTGISYDIKAFSSRENIEQRIADRNAAAGRPAPRFRPDRRLRGQYDGESAITDIRAEIDQGHRVVIDPRNLQPADLADLRRRVDDEGLGGSVDWWTPPPP
jgi:pretoxin HINT domain-containing protein